MREPRVAFIVVFGLVVTDAIAVDRDFLSNLAPLCKALVLRRVDNCKGRVNVRALSSFAYKKHDSPFKFCLSNERHLLNRISHA